MIPKRVDDAGPRPTLVDGIGADGTGADGTAADRVWIDRVWRLVPDQGAPALLMLLADGRVAGRPGDTMPRWRADGHGVCLLDGLGAPALRFAPDGHGVLRAATAVLNPAAPLPAVRPGTPTRRSPTGRRNLVVLRAGDQSLHPGWRDDLPDAGRTWDFCVSYFGDDPAAVPGPWEFLIPGKGSKFAGLAALMAAEDFVWAYDHVWFPDDDLMTSWTDINRMFGICRDYHLTLAQPALHPDSFINQWITRQADDLLLRFTSFVEIMAPVFSRDALARCWTSFALNDSGYGIDHLWPALSLAAPNRMGVIDAVAVIHTRPMGRNYDLRAAVADGWRIEDTYGLVQQYLVRGGIARKPFGVIKHHNHVLGAFGRDGAPLAPAAGR